MALIKNNQQGQSYKAILGKDINIDSEGGELKIRIQVFIFSSGRESYWNGISLSIPDTYPAIDIKDAIYDEIINLCDRNGWPIQRSDIISI